jgi:hypothetical protein
MTRETHEKCKRIIDMLGEEKIDELYYCLGSEKISFAMLKKIMDQGKLKKKIDGKKPIAVIAKENGVSAKTIYRLLK